MARPDAADAARDLPPAQIPAPVVEVRQSATNGFDWGDAGIGAAGMIALFSIAAGSALLLTTRRRQGSQTIARSTARRKPAAPAEGGASA